MTLSAEYAVAAKSKFDKNCQSKLFRERKCCYVSCSKQDVNGIECFVMFLCNDVTKGGYEHASATVKKRRDGRPDAGAARPLN